MEKSELHNFIKSRRERTFYISDIKEDVINNIENQITEDFLMLESMIIENGFTYRFDIINSLGGSLHAALRLVARITEWKSKYPLLRFYSYIPHLCYSAAAIIAVVMDKRSMSNDCGIIMIHNVCSNSIGKTSTIIDLCADLTELKILNEIVIELFVKHTNQCKENIINMMHKTTYIRAQQAQEYGFIDFII